MWIEYLPVIILHFEADFHPETVLEKKRVRLTPWLERNRFIFSSG